MITCPWFSVEALVLLTVVPIQASCIPDKVGGDQRVVQQVKRPIPQRPNMYLEGF